MTNVTIDQTVQDISVTVDETTNNITVEVAVAGSGGTSDHGSLSGLGDDDHSQYALADGTRGSFATTAQGTLADSALQSGDNVSELTNDAGYITSASVPTNTSDLTNDGADNTSTYVEHDELGTVATSNDYNDLDNLPSIPSGTVTSVSVSGSDGIEIDSGSPITTSGTIALGINASTLRSHINVEDGAEVNDVDSVNGETGVVVLTEEDIIGTSIEDATWSGTENLDLSTFRGGEFTLTGNTTLTVSNTPSADDCFVVSFGATSSTTESLTLPGGWNVYGAFSADGTRNFLAISFNNLTTAGAVVDCFISQPS